MFQAVSDPPATHPRSADDVVILVAVKVFGAVHEGQAVSPSTLPGGPAALPASAAIKIPAWS